MRGAAIKVALKGGKSETEALQAPGIVDFIDEILAMKKAADQQAGDQTPAAAGPSDAQESKAGDDVNEIAFHLKGKDAKDPPRVVRPSTITDSTKREMVESIIAATRQNFAANVHLVRQVTEPPRPNGLQGALMATPLGKVPKNTPTYVGVFYDPKMSAEASRRPAIRVPPLRQDPWRASSRLSASGTLSVIPS